MGLPDDGSNRSESFLDARRGAMWDQSAKKVARPVRGTCVADIRIRPAAYTRARKEPGPVRGKGTGKKKVAPAVGRNGTAAGKKKARP